MPPPFVTSSPPGQLGPRRAHEIIAIGVMGALAMISLGWLAYRAALPFEIDRNEPWNAWHAAALIEGRSLYPGLSDLVVNNYPPLSFYIIRLFAAAGLDPIYVGRMISIVSTLVVALATAASIRRLGGTRYAAIFGALWYLATMVVGYRFYVGMNDPNLLGLAVMSAALVWFLSRLSAGKATEPAIFAMVLAGFIKHNLLAIPLTALVWLAIVDRRAALRAAVFGAAAAAAGLALCVAAYGPVFIEQLLMPRSMDMTLRRLIITLGRLNWVAAALIFWAFWAYANRSSPAARFTALFISIASVIGLVARFGAGVDNNVLFELVFATAVGLGLAFGDVKSVPAAVRFGLDRTRSLIAAVLIARLLLSLNFEPYLMLASGAFRDDVAKRVEILKGEVARISAIPGPVSCSLMTICYLAGKPFVFDDFAVAQRIASGRMSKEQLDAVLKSRGIRFETVDARLRWRDLRITLSGLVPKSPG